MVRIEIDEQACRGCQTCMDVCPTKVLDYDEAEAVAKVREAEDCIACLSCAYLCPSNGIRHDDYPVVRNSYRDIEFVEWLERFL